MGVDATGHISRRSPGPTATSTCWRPRPFELDDLAVAEWSSLDEGSPEDQRLVEEVDGDSGLYSWSADGDYLGWRATFTDDGRWTGFSLGARPAGAP